MALVRDSHWIEREYGREKWPEIERLVDEVVADEDDFARPVCEVARRERYSIGPLESTEAIFGGVRTHVPAAIVRVSAVRGGRVHRGRPACGRQTGGS
jgi:hypothetical protein